MQLNLERPLLFFDIESTGLNIAEDAIIELGFVKVFPDGKEEIKTWRLRPWDYVNNCQKEINAYAFDVHGIKDEELKDCPRFIDIVDEVITWVADADFAGFNASKFDLPLLAEEIERVEKYYNKTFDLDLHSKQMVDIQNIYHYLEPRNLKAAYRFYCEGEELENAHSAAADTLATYKILKAQLDRYPDKLANDVKSLSKVGGRVKTLDFAGRLAYNKKEVVLCFGKYKGKTVKEVYKMDPHYFSWIENGQFTLDTKKQFALLKKALDEEKYMKKSQVLNEQQTLEARKKLAEKYNSEPLF